MPRCLPPINQKTTFFTDWSQEAPSVSRNTFSTPGMSVLLSTIVRSEALGKGSKSTQVFEWLRKKFTESTAKQVCTKECILLFSPPSQQSFFGRRSPDWTTLRKTAQSLCGLSWVWDSRQLWRSPIQSIPSVYACRWMLTALIPCIKAHSIVTKRFSRQRAGEASILGSELLYPIIWLLKDFAGSVSQRVFTKLWTPLINKTDWIIIVSKSSHSII